MAGNSVQRKLKPPTTSTLKHRSLYTIHMHRHQEDFSTTSQKSNGVFQPILTTKKCHFRMKTSCEASTFQIFKAAIDRTSLCFHNKHVELEPLLRPILKNKCDSGNMPQHADTDTKLPTQYGTKKYCIAMVSSSMRYSTVFYYMKNLVQN